MKKALTFEEAAELLETGEPNVVNDPDLLDFIETVQNFGKEIFRDKGENYLDSASTFILAAVVSELLLEHPAMAATILKHSKVFKTIIEPAIVYSVGLAAVEKLR